MGDAEETVREPSSVADPPSAGAEGPGDADDDRSARVTRRIASGERVLRDAWERNAELWIAWARTPMHDSFWRFHRDQFLTLLPEPGALTVDIGAGEGRLSRELARRGHTVVAVDASPTLAVAAREADPTTGIVVADAAALSLRDGVADLAIAFMSLQDVDDLHGAVHEAARVLRPGGHLCVAIVHPLNSAGQFVDDDPDGNFVIDGSYLAPRLYSDELEREGLTMEFVGTHRPLQEYIAACRDAGLLIEELREPAMPDEAIRRPRQRRWQRVPLFLHLRAIRSR